MKKILLFTAALFLISSCKSLQNLSDSISKPSLSITNVRVTDFNFNEIELTYDVQVDNPNPVALQMLSYGYNFKVNNNDFVQGTEDERVRIESSGSSTFQLPVRLNYQQLYNLFNSLRGKDEANYQLAANLDFDLPVLGKTTLPLKKSGQIPLLKLPKVAVSSIKVNDLNFSKADLTLNLKVDNPNGFGLLINALSYDLNVNGKNWLTGNNSENMSIAKNGSRQLAIPISLNISQIGASVFQLLNNSGDLNYKLDGNFNFGATHSLFNNMSTNFSFDKNGLVPLTR